MTSTAPKILIIRLSALGDIIQTLPILSMIRQTYPQATIGWVIDEALAPILKGHPDIDHLHVISQKKWLKTLKNPLAWCQTYDAFQQFLSTIKNSHYDIGIDAQGLFKTALLLSLTGIERRIGFAHQREMTHWFYTEKYVNHNDYFDHRTFRLAHLQRLMAAIGCQNDTPPIQLVPILPEAEMRVKAWFQAAFTQADGPIVAIAPATQWASKHWPTLYWAGLLTQLLSETRVNIVIIATSQDNSLVQQILEGVDTSHYPNRILNLAGQTSLSQLREIYGQVAIAVGPDSAPLHLAGAAHVPALIGLYGPTGYRRTPPYGSPNIQFLSSEGQLACQPCHKAVCPLGTTQCMVNITPDAVFQAIQRVV